jgi:hypothetical protein
MNLFKTTGHSVLLPVGKGGADDLSAEFAFEEPFRLMNLLVGVVGVETHDATVFADPYLFRVVFQKSEVPSTGELTSRRHFTRRRPGMKKEKRGESYAYCFALRAIFC